MDDGALDDNVESFLSQDDSDPRDAIGRSMDVTKGLLALSSNFLLRIFHHLRVIENNHI